MASGKSVLGSFLLFAYFLASSSAQELPAAAFEVASVRLSPPESLGMNAHMVTDNSRADYIGFPLSAVLSQAFRLEEVDQLVGPGWLTEVHIDIHATLPSGSSKDQVPAMLQNLLIDRFGLKSHHEQRLTAVYSLKTISGAAPLTPTNDDGPPDFSGRGKYVCHRCTMDGLAKALNAMRLRPLGPFRDLNRNVINATGLEGKYDFTLNMGTPRSPDSAPDAPDDTRTVVQALRDIGLLLEPDKVQTDYVVIDQMLKTPTRN